MDRAKPGLASAWRKFELRAYRLAEGAPLAGSSVAEAEARVAEHRLFIHRLRRREDPFPIVVEVPKVRSWQTLLSQNERHAGRELIWNAKTPALIGLSRDEALDLAEILRRYAEEIPEVHRGT